MWQARLRETLLRRALLVVAAVAALAAVAGVGAAGAPAVSVTVDGDAVADGQTVATRTDPRVGVSVESNATVDLVEVRVDGEVRERFRPGTPSFSRTVRLALDGGRHGVQVVARAGETTRVEFTVVEDGAGPFVAYTAPFETPDMSAPPDRTSVERAEVTLSGTLADDTGVASIEIERRYDFSFAGRSETSRAFYRVEDPGDSFAQTVLLGHGDNDLTVRYTDDVGNVRVHRFELDVDDETPPRINATVPTRTAARSVRVVGVVSDDVKVDSVRVGSFSSAASVVLSRTSPEPDPDRLSVAIDRRVRLSEGENGILVSATDVAGQTTRREFDVVYDPDADPRVSVDAGRTRFEDGTLAVRARVDGAAVARVTVEAVDAATGTVVDAATAYDGDGQPSRVDVDESVAVADGETRIRVVATDALGDRHERSFGVDPRTGSVSLDGPVPSPTTATPGDAGGTATDRARKTATGVATRTASGATATPTEPPGSGEGDADDSSAVGPGFTPLVALLAVLVVCVRLVAGR